MAGEVLNLLRRPRRAAALMPFVGAAAAFAIFGGIAGYVSGGSSTSAAPSTAIAPLTTVPGRPAVGDGYALASVAVTRVLKAPYRYVPPAKKRTSTVTQTQTQTQSAPPTTQTSTPSSSTPSTTQPTKKPQSFDSSG